MCISSTTGNGRKKEACEENIKRKMLKTQIVRLFFLWFKPNDFLQRFPLKLLILGRIMYLMDFLCLTYYYLLHYVNISFGIISSRNTDLTFPSVNVFFFWKEIDLLMFVCLFYDMVNCVLMRFLFFEIWSWTL